MIETAQVLHIGKYFPPVPGGVESFLADLLTASTRHGLKAHALVHVRPDQPAFAHNPAHSLHTVKSYGEVVHTPIAPGFPLALRQTLQKARPQILHLHLPNPSAFFVLTEPLARALPWVVHWHSDVVTQHHRTLALLYHLYRPFEQALLARARTIIVNSPAYLDASPALAAVRPRCQCIPLGIDPQRLPVATPTALAWAARQWPAQGLKLLAVGRLVPYKGFEVLIKALARLPECQLVIVGTGPLEATLQTLIHALGLSKRVRLTGYLDNDRLGAMMAHCEVVCLPSIMRSEAFGLVLLEAMHYAKPVVASDIPGSGIASVVREGGHGLLATPQDPHHLASCLRRLAADPALRENLGQRGAQRFASRFHIDRHLEKLLRTYAQLAPNLQFQRP